MKKAVFLCTCEDTLDKTLDFNRLAEASSKLKDVVHSEIHPSLCSRNGIDTMQSRIGSKEADRVIIGACSPRKFEDFFTKVMHEMNNGNMILEQAAIREHAAWSHGDAPEIATNVAKILIDISDASVSLSEPFSQKTVRLEKGTLIIGGGMAGMQSALDLADSGIPVVLVEREKGLGGRARFLAKTYPTSNCGICCIESCIDCILTPKAAEVLVHPKITTYLQSEVADIKGRFGNYDFTVKTSDGEEVKLKAGIIFIATGSEVFDPSSIQHYNYSHPDVITNFELSNMLIAQRGQGKLSRPSDGQNPKVINFVLCVGSRAQNPALGSPHCSIVCCNFAIGQAKSIRQTHPEIEVYIHYTDLRAPYRGFEDFYREARRSGVTFIRGRVAEIREMPGMGLQVLSKDTDLGKTLEINSDLVVLCVGQERPPGTNELSKMLHRSLETDKFFRELNLRLKGLNRVHSRISEPGVFVVGCARGPRGIPHSIGDARTAAMTAIQLFESYKVPIGRIKAYIVDKRCDGCAYCVDPCPFNAITLVDTDNGKLALIDETYCEGCGICQATCPKDGVHVRNFTQEQIRAKVNRALAYSTFNPRILAFLCNWCGFPAADLAGVNRSTYPPIVPIRVMCSGMIHPNIIIDALTRGADGILVFGCLMDECHYFDGNKIAEQRQQAIELMMTDLGLEPKRLRVEWIAGRQWKKFSGIIHEFHEDIKKLEPNPFT
ncbi:MAG: hydrogenase iron-sulfur subunit [Candidatus Heimdallarchaeota archaeon]